MNIYENKKYITSVNEKYIRTWDRISSKFEIVHKASAKYWTLYKIASQIENVIKTM